MTTYNSPRDVEVTITQKLAEAGFTSEVKYARTVVNSCVVVTVALSHPTGYLIQAYVLGEPEMYKYRIQTRSGDFNWKKFLTNIGEMVERKTQERKAQEQSLVNMAKQQKDVAKLLSKYSSNRKVLATVVTPSDQGLRVNISDLTLDQADAIIAKMQELGVI